MVVLLVSSTVRAGGTDIGPDSAEIRQAQKLAATLRGAGGIERAMRILCRDEASDHRLSAARGVLIERAAEAMPRLLDAVELDVAPNSEPTCSYAASRIAVAAVCTGRSDGDIYGLDHRSETAVHRSRVAAGRALLRALAQPGARRRAAVRVLRLARPSEFEFDPQRCEPDATADLLRRASPALARMLSTKDRVADVLRLLASADADRTVAVPAVRPFLADRASFPLAVLALAQLEQDMSQSVPQLAELLDGPEIALALEALSAIGERARAALPRLAALSSRIDVRLTKPEDEYLFIRAIRSVAKRPDDTRLALQTLSTIQTQRPFLLRSTAEAMLSFGPDGRNALLSYLHSDDNTIEHRLDVARILQPAGLSSADEALMRLLQARPTHDDQSTKQDPTPAPPRDPIVDLAEDVALCRGEAGLPPVAVAGVSIAQAATIETCLHNYLCGPSRTTLARTLDRCCGPIGGAQKLAFCRP